MFKKYKIILINISALLLVLGGVVLAGELNNNLAPSSTTIPVTFQDIYNKLTDPNYTANPSHNLYASASIAGGSMPSLSAIYDVVPAYKTLDGSTTTVEAGIYATTTLTDIEAGLSPGNIASGVTIFGVTGTFECTP